MPTPALKIVCKIAEIVASSSEYHKTLQEITRVVATGVGVEVCNILVFDDASEQLILEGTHGFGKEAVHKVKLPPDQGIVGYCFRRLEVVNVARKQEHPDFKAFATDRAADYSSLLAVPLVAGGRAIGVINLESRVAEPFQPATVATTQAIAAPIAAYARNRNLYKEIESHARRRSESGVAHQVLKGTPVTEGVVRGHAYFLVGAETLEQTPIAKTDDLGAQHKLFQQAMEVARQDILDLQEEASEVLAEAESAIFCAHVVLLEDPLLLQYVEEGIDEGYEVRSALKRAYQQFGSEFAKVKSALVAERMADLKDVILRIYQALDEVEGVSRRPAEMAKVKKNHQPIVVVHELLPSQLIRLPLGELGGIICEAGGMTSHVAILARTLRIPMVVGVEGATQAVHQEDEIILDCTTGNCYVRPSKQVVERFRSALSVQGRVLEKVTLRPEPMTRDGVPMRLGGNVALLNELPLLSHYGATGIGLYRTEFMFMIRNSSPSEEEQYGLFRRVVEGCNGGSVTIRLLDVGGDKPLPYVDFGDEENPFLGYRGMRFLLSNPHFVEPHLRAILRTTVHGRVNILLPMVADVEELLLIKAHIEKAREELRQSGIAVADNYRLGLMLEVPSAVWALPRMLEHIDFVSVGTNDLIQYTFAVDRGNPRINRWFRQFHPIVLQIIKQACDLVAGVEGKALSICGEIAGNPVGVPLLIGAGVRYLSMTPCRIPAVADAVASVTVPDCEQLLAEALACNVDQDVVALMGVFAAKHGIPTA